MKLDIMKLQIAMSNACMNKGELAEKTGLSRISISKYFKDTRNPSTKTVGKIAKALGVPVESIIKDTD